MRSPFLPPVGSSRSLHRRFSSAAESCCSSFSSSLSPAEAAGTAAAAEVDALTREDSDESVSTTSHFEVEPTSVDSSGMSGPSSHVQAERASEVLELRAALASMEESMAITSREFQRMLQHSEEAAQMVRWIAARARY